MENMRDIFQRLKDVDRHFRRNLLADGRRWIWTVIIDYYLFSRFLRGRYHFSADTLLLNLENGSIDPGCLDDETLQQYVARMRQPGISVDELFGVSFSQLVQHDIVIIHLHSSTAVNAMESSLGCTVISFKKYWLALIFRHLRLYSSGRRVTLHFITGPLMHFIKFKF